MKKTAAVILTAPLLIVLVTSIIGQFINIFKNPSQLIGMGVALGLVFLAFVGVSLLHDANNNDHDQT